MARKHRYTPQEVADAITKTRGMIFLASKALGCSHETVNNYVKKYPIVARAKAACRGEMVDTAELKLWQSIQNGEAWGISLALRTIGKDRGYGETLDLKGISELGQGLASLLGKDADASDTPASETE